MRAQPVKVGDRWLVKSWHTGPNGGDCVALSEEGDSIVDTKNGATLKTTLQQVKALVKFARNWPHESAAVERASPR